MTNRKTDWSNNVPSDWLTSCSWLSNLINWLAGLLTEKQLTRWLASPLTDRLTEQLTELLCKERRVLLSKQECPFASTVKGWVFIFIGIHENVMQSNLFNMDTKGAIESVHINGMSILSSLNLETKSVLVSFPNLRFECNGKLFCSENNWCASLNILNFCFQIRCHRKTGQRLSQAKSLCYLHYCKCCKSCFVIQLLSEPDKQDCWPGDFKIW